METQDTKNVDKYCLHSKKVIKKEILRILTEKEVEGPVKSKILNSLVNFTHSYLKNSTNSLFRRE